MALERKVNIKFEKEKWFNDFIYESVAPNFTIEPNRRYNEILHLTYFVKSAISDSAAKVTRFGNMHVACFLMR